jgi:hypothetical protein
VGKGEAIKPGRLSREHCHPAPWGVSCSHFHPKLVTCKGMMSAVEVVERPLSMERRDFLLKVDRGAFHGVSESKD